MAQNDPRAFLAAIARILNDMRIPYLVTGGMSVVVWGRPRFTADVDVFIGIEPHELATFAKRIYHTYGDEDGDWWIASVRLIGQPHNPMKSENDQHFSLHSSAFTGDWKKVIKALKAALNHYLQHAS